MNHLHLIGKTATLLGIVLIGLGIFCYFYYEVHGWLIAYAVFPFRHYTMPLVITGVILLVIGIMLLQTERR